MASLWKKRKRSEEKEEDEIPKRQKSGAEGGIAVVVAGKWKEGLSDLLQWQEKEEKRQRDALLLRRRDAVAMDTRTENVGLIDPEARLADLRRDLYSSGMIPTKQQKQLFDLTMAVSLKWIIGDDFELHKPDLLKLMGLTDLFHDVHFIMPRQYGKTTGVALTVKTLALNVPMKICIFSTGARTARALMKMIVKFIEQTPGGRERIVTKNAEELCVSTVAFSSKKDIDPRLCCEIRALPASGPSKFLFIFL